MVNCCSLRSAGEGFLHGPPLSKTWLVMMCKRNCLVTHPTPKKSETLCSRRAKSNSCYPWQNLPFQEPVCNNLLKKLETSTVQLGQNYLQIFLSTIPLKFSQATLPSLFKLCKDFIQEQVMLNLCNSTCIINSDCGTWIS